MDSMFTSTLFPSVCIFNPKIFLTAFRTSPESLLCLCQAVPWQEYPSWAGDDLLDLPFKGRFIGPVAVVDGYVLEAPPFEVWEQKREYSDVPFVVGTTDQEGDFR